jgi:hypothetical protein
MSTGLAATAETAQLLTNKAWGDFAHDFDDTVRANVTVGILNQIPIESTQSIKGAYRTLLERIQAASGGKSSTTAFQMFKAGFPTTLPPDTGAALPQSVLHETDIVNLVNIPYQGIISKLHTTSPQVVPMTPLQLRGRNYSVSAVPEKMNGVHAHMVSCLKALTGVNVFVLMWDAGSCEISEIGSAFDGTKVIPGFDPTQLYTVYILNSKGNLSDPAPKPTIDTLKSVNPNVKLVFLEEVDPTAPTVYPIWRTGGNDPKASVYSGYTFTTRRAPNEKRVSATLRTPSGLGIDIDDVKETSKVANAVANAVLAMLFGDPVEKIMAYFFLKRAGDWCQALDLDDMVQQYRAVQPGGGPPEIVTLADLKARGAIPILITNDRVLLAYAVALGLNVIFTTVRATLNWLVFFRNLDEGRTDDAASVLAGASAILTQRIDPLIAQVTAAMGAHAGFIAQALAALSSSSPAPDLRNFLLLRNSVFVLARLPRLTALTSLKQLLQTEGQLASSQQVTQQQLVGALGKLRSAITTMLSLESVLPTLIPPPTAPALIYPDVARESQTITNLAGKLTAGGFSTTSDDYIQFQTLIDRLATDLKGLDWKGQLLPSDAQIRQSGIPYLATRASRASPGFTTLGLLYDYFNRTVGPPSMRGGAGVEAGLEPYVLEVLRSAKTIRPYTLETAAEAYAVDAEDFIAKDKNFIRELDGTHITVVDGFLTHDIDLETVETLLTPAATNQVFVMQPGTPPSVSLKPAAPGSAAPAVPFLYGLLKGVLTQVDVHYDALLGLQSQDEASPNALTSLRYIEQDITLLEAIAMPKDLEPVLTPQVIGRLFTAVNAWATATIPPANADAIITSLYQQASIDGGIGLRSLLETEYKQRGERVDSTFYVEENALHAMYRYYTSRTLTRLLTARDYLIETFSTPLFTQGGPTLAAYSRYLQDLPVLKPVPPSENAPAAAVEKAITDSFLGKTSGAVAPGTTGGFQAPPTLSTNARTPEVIPPTGGRRGLYTRLRQRAGEGSSPGV